MLWEDLCDDSSVQRFAAGATDNGGNEESTGTSAVLVEVEDEQSSTEDEGTAPPTAAVVLETELLEASAMTIEENSGGGVTILSSVDSSNEDDAVAHPPRVGGNVPSFLPEELAAAAEPSRGSASLMTEESVSLSLHPSSIDSSVMTEFTETSSLTASVAPSLDELSSIAESSVSSASEQRSHVYDTHDPLLEGSAEQQMQREWYSRFRNEQEWRDFQASVKEVVEALADEDGDVTAEKRDELLAQLIANEEFFFWGEHQEASIARAVPQNSWIWTLLAAAGTAAVAGVALVRIVKGRA